MKDTNNTKGRLRRSDVSSNYELLRNDGKEYSQMEELNRLNFSMSLMSKKGVVITGGTGTGKTALVRSFAQQNLAEMYGFESVQIIQLNEDFGLDGEGTEETVFDSFSELCDEYSGSAVILYAKLTKIDRLAKSIRFVEKYSHEFEKYYNLKLFKIIFEFPINNAGEYKEFKKLCASHEFDRVEMEEYYSVSFLIDRIMPRIKEFSSRYNVGYSDEILKYYVSIIQSGFDNVVDLSEYVEKMGIVFEVSQKHGKNMLDKDIAKLVWSERFEGIQKLGPSSIKLTAFHEAGHVLLHLCGQGDSINYVTIIPIVNRYRGVTSVYRDNYSGDRGYSSKMLLVEALLAGRLSEEKFEGQKSFNEGAIRDLQNAMKEINNMVNSLGASVSLGYNYVTDKDVRLSEGITECLEREKREILRQAEYKVNELLRQHWTFVERLANRLCSEFIIVGDEIYKMWTDYLAEIE